MTDDTLFAEQVEKRLEAIASNGSPGFSELLQQLRGVYPVVAVAAINRLIARDSRFSSLLPDSSNGTTAYPTSEMDDCDWLPRPHPLDFDWRFDAATKRSLVGEVGGRVPGRGLVSLFGAPTLLPYLAASDLRVKVVDANELVITAVMTQFPNVAVRHVDLVQDDPEVGKADSDFVIADPPWYLGHTKSFLWSASHCCKAAGTVLCSLPGVGTRPNVVAERDELFDYARKIGLAVREVREGAVRYVSPPFERNALRAAGVNAPTDWRAGDLAVFARRGQNREPRPLAPHAPAWKELRFGNVRIRAKLEVPVASDPRLWPLVTGDILDSVSQRDPRVGRVDVWTAGNRVFACRDTIGFMEIAKRIQQRQPLGNNDYAEEVREQLCSLVAQEASEA